MPALQAGLVWFGPHVASTTVFAPYAASGVKGINAMLSVGDPHTLARNSGMVGCNEAVVVINNAEYCTNLSFTPKLIELSYPG